MIHLETHCPSGISLAAKASPILGFTAQATEVTSGRTVTAWGPTEEDARQRAEFLVQVQS